VDFAVVAGHGAAGCGTATVLGMDVPVVRPRQDARSAGSNPAGGTPVVAVQSMFFGTVGCPQLCRTLGSERLPSLSGTSWPIFRLAQAGRRSGIG
jgi:hypothetical protein